MPVSYKLFTVLLHAMGIYPVSNHKLRFHLKTWMPNIFWLSILMLKGFMEMDKKAFSDYKLTPSPPNKTANVPNVNYNSNSTTAVTAKDTADTDANEGFEWNNEQFYHHDEEDGSDMEAKVYKVMVFFIFEDYVYRTLILIFSFRCRFLISALKLEIIDIENNLKHPSRFNRRMMKSGLWFLVLNVAVFLSFSGIDLNGAIQSFNSTKRFVISLIVDNLSAIIETIGTFAVEGLLIYYSLFFKYIIKEYNEDLKGFFDTSLKEEDTDSKRNLEQLQELRLRLVDINSMFEKTVSIMSVLLAISVFDSLLTACFGIFYIDKSAVTNELQSIEFLNRVVLKMFISKIKLLIICVGDYPFNEASKTYRLLSGVKLPNSTDNAIKEEMILLHLTKNSVTFRFTLGGFCDLKKSLLPTIAGTVITYTVILCQD